MEPLEWIGPHDRLTVDPAAGGRVLSWRRAPHGELVRQPELLDGGLGRMLLGEERYPGAGYITPHRVLTHSQDGNGFRIELQFYWNTANAFAHRFGWQDKVNPGYLDGLLLDKTLTFHAASSTLEIAWVLTNLSGEKRFLSPWLHNHFAGWVDHAFVLLDGVRQPFRWEEMWWAGHRPPATGPMRLVHADKGGTFTMVLGSATDWLAGMASYTQFDFGAGSTEGCMELRGRAQALEPGQCFHANAFLAATDGSEGWQRWANATPIPLYATIGPARTDWTPAALMPLLDAWALPAEHEAGLMILSHRDKVPYTSAQRYAAALCFAGFHRVGGRARARVWLYALRDIADLTVRLTATRGWRLAELPSALRAGTLTPLELEGPRTLRDAGRVRVRIAPPGGIDTILRIPADAAAEPDYPYQVQQVAQYLEERWNKERGFFTGDRPAALRAWQRRQRAGLHTWTRAAIGRPAPLVARIVEEQTGPFCIRQKILLQTEAGVWLPTYLVLPRRRATRPRPAILFPHGSGPGKQHFAPDEEAAFQAPTTFDTWPSPYQFAHQLGCAVLLPDRRGWGEWAEANHGQQSQRAHGTGYNIHALEVWDHLRAVDYLAGRRDIDAQRITCMGSSGGGLMTMMVCAMHTGVAGGIISSSSPFPPALPEHFFHRRPTEELAAPWPSAHVPLASGAITCLAAPRALWIMDGREDRCALPPLPLSHEEEQVRFAAWREWADAARVEIERVYALAGAADRLRVSWFEGGHLAGFTFTNIRAWLYAIGVLRGNHTRNDRLKIRSMKR